MATHRLVFTTTTTSELKFTDSEVTSDNGMTIVWKDGEKLFCVPTSSIVAIERLQPMPPVDVTAPD